MRASGAAALRADGLGYTVGLLLTQPISPTDWTDYGSPIPHNSASHPIIIFF